ncbi:AAA family ATPase (plasmid) [Sphingobium sp. V4]|uniref:AAA family ATPase n=1 Tax=Sphingobium sp. V4 TaxID=3038927 RepID=UPI00255805B6|nr:AAA family ATPase [Sphingobium sp. V4]WIW90618.1 AAA family ATPase [Sphingobium sp. V4]
MGAPDFPADQMKHAAPGEGPRVLIVASPREIAPLTAVIEDGGLSGVMALPLDSDEPLGGAQLGRARLLVLEVDPGSSASMQRLTRVAEERPGLIVIAAVRDATVSLIRTIVREGVADVVSLPFDPQEVLQATLDAMARRDGDTRPPTTLAPLLSVVRSVGGCGATTVATHLAGALAASDTSGKGALVADLDVQFGTVTDYLGLAPNGRLNDLLEAHGRLDEELLKSVVIGAGEQLSVVAAPDTIMPLEQIDTDQLLKVIQLFRQQYGMVVLDLPADWTSWTLSAAAESDAILMVVELSLPSLRQAKRRLDLFRSVGIEDSAVHIVANRVERRLFSTIDLSDVARTLSHPVLASLALEEPLVSAAQNQGQLVNAVRPKSRFATDITKLAALLRSGPLNRGG